VKIPPVKFRKFSRIFNLFCLLTVGSSSGSYQSEPGTPSLFAPVSGPRRAPSRSLKGREPSPVRRLLLDLEPSDSGVGRSGGAIGLFPLLFPPRGSLRWSRFSLSEDGEGEGDTAVLWRVSCAGVRSRYVEGSLDTLEDTRVFRRAMFGYCWWSRVKAIGAFDAIAPSLMRICTRLSCGDEVAVTDDLLTQRRCRAATQALASATRKSLKTCTQ